MKREHASDVQSARGKLPRGPGAGRPKGSATNYNTVAQDHAVGDEAHCDERFTFKRAAAFQCVEGETYEVSTDDPEEKMYFAAALEAIIEHMVYAAGTPACEFLELTHAELNAYECDAVLDLQSVQYGQLARCDAPPNALEANDKYQMYDGTRGGKAVKMVVAPLEEGGWHAEILSNHKVRMSLVLVYFVNIYGADEELYLRVSLGQRGKHVYVEGQSTREQVVKLSFGTYGPPFVEKATVVCGDKGMFEKMTIAGWTPVSGSRRGRDEEEEPDDAQAEEGARFEVNADHKLYKVTGVGEKKQQLALANFHVMEIMNIYEVPNSACYTKLLVSHVPDKGDADGPIVYVGHNDLTRPDYSGASEVQIEVVLCIGVMKSSTCVRAQFCKASAFLRTLEYMSLGTLVAYLDTFTHPTPQQVVTYFGEQSCGNFVLANVAFKNGTTTPIAESPFHVMTDYFKNQPRCPINEHHFPKMKVIPYPWVRYYIGAFFFGNVMPRYFQNNTPQARTVFAFAVLSLNSQKCASGSGGIESGKSALVAQSPEQNTGKSASIHTARSLHGYHSFPKIGGDATKPALFKLASYSTLLIAVDDFLPPRLNENEGRSQAMLTIVRGFYETADRVTCEAVDTPRGIIAVSTNFLINADDAANASRITNVPFDALNAAEDDDHDLSADFSNGCELLSALMPDLQLIGLYNGELDGFVIRDFQTYFNTLFKCRRDRSCNEYGKVMYIYAMLLCLYQRPDDYAQMFDYFVVMLTRTLTVCTNHSGVIDQFLISMLRVYEDMGIHALQSGGPGKLIFHHNLRTNLKPPKKKDRDMTVDYWAIRVDLVIEVIKAVTKRSFNAAEIVQAASKSTFAFVGTAKFYDAQHNVWPLVETIEMADPPYQSKDKPLDEEDLLPETLDEYDCLWVYTSRINDIRNDRKMTAADMGVDDYEDIVINSANPEIGTYKFYEWVTNPDNSYIYRSVHAHPYGDLRFLNPQARQSGFGDEVGDAYQLTALNRMFGYDPPDEMDLPLCVVDNPFKTTLDDDEPLSQRSQDSHATFHQAVDGVGSQDSNIPLAELVALAEFPEAQNEVCFNTT